MYNLLDGQQNYTQVKIIIDFYSRIAEGNNICNEHITIICMYETFF